jgi:FHA domain
MAVPTPATGRDIIQELIRNLREGLEPLQYSILPPTVFRVYLHADDLARLGGILPRIVDEARRALDTEVAALNKESLAQKLHVAPKSEAKVEAPPSGWTVQFLENTEDETHPGDIVVDSELALPSKQDYGTGAMTKRIATSRLRGETRSSQRYEAAPATGGETYATIEYEDQGGRQTYRVMKDQVVIGRGGREYWTDVTLNTLPDVSREHIRLRRDPATGKFYLKDLSRLGTTIDGQKAPSSIEYAGGEKRDKNVEVELPASAEIGLADVVVLTFRQAADS